ncbi:MAG: UbiA family prenyltransferase [Alphaproteobacteria bacterium]|nr:UbiA family prenyltransferase [Alphaproteobacteria bacterium]
MEGAATRPTTAADAALLCVDLDGTLVRTDVGVESILALLKRNPLHALALPVWFARGKASLKHEVARRAEIDAASLPYNEALVEHLRAEKAAGRRLVLATATNERYARAVADHLDLFEAVIASDEATNLKGEAKLARMQAFAGTDGFDYAGNAAPDLRIWPHAREAIVVSPGRGVLDRARRIARVGRVFDAGGGRLADYLRALQPYQWLKNLLLLVPLFAAHRVGEIGLLADVILAFIAFGLTASSVYLVNDLLDLAADRRHARKRYRPIASGRVPVQHAALLAPLLLLLALVIASALPLVFLGMLFLYYVTSTAYSFWLKRVELVDVLVLAGLYTLRIVAGAMAVSVALSFWLLAFSMFFFLSLALVKRYSELLALQEAGGTVAAGRGYQVSDLETLHALGAASGYTSVLVLALYVNSEKVLLLYRHPEAVWLVCPLILYWISRVWLAARRGTLQEDPVLFALRDSPSRCVALILMLAA